jgi:hypothetical protein
VGFLNCGNEKFKLTFSSPKYDAQISLSIFLKVNHTHTHTHTHTQNCVVHHKLKTKLHKYNTNETWFFLRLITPTQKRKKIRVKVVLIFSPFSLYLSRTHTHTHTYTHTQIPLYTQWSERTKIHTTLHFHKELSDLRRNAFNKSVHQKQNGYSWIITFQKQIHLYMYLMWTHSQIVNTPPPHFPHNKSLRNYINTVE